MNYKRLLLAVFAVWSHWSAAFAQDIDVKQTFQQGDKMVARLMVEPLANSEPVYEWTASEGIAFEPVGDNRTLHFWAKQSGRLELKATYTLNYLAPDPADPTKGIPSKLTLPPYFHSAEFTVEGVGPAPVVKTLRDRVTAEQAPLLSALYADLIAVLERGKPLRSGTFRTTHDEELSFRKLDGHGATAEINRRLGIVLGKADVALDPDLRPKLIAELQKFRAEFGAGPQPPPDPSDPATAATYIYEKDNGGVPPAVSAALSELNTDTFRATTFEEDTTDSSGEVPDQYKVPLISAQGVGTPALVVMAGEKVRRVVKAPTTREQVLEAVK